MKSVDLKTKVIVDLPSLLSERSSASAQLLNDFIYVFGGLNQKSVLSTVERYEIIDIRNANPTILNIIPPLDISLPNFRFDFVKNEWTEVAPLPAPRCYSTHVVLADFLFVIGGRNAKFNAVNSVEYYEPLTDNWQSAAPLLHERECAAACVSNGFIYVLGGDDHSKLLQSIERYDRRDNSWTEVRQFVHHFLSAKPVFD